MKDFGEFMAKALANKTGKTYKDNQSWEEYERRKKNLSSMNLTPSQYNEACDVIVKELGI